MKTLCMDCKAVIRDGDEEGPISHGVCEPCFVERTAHYRPHSLAEWINEPRTTGNMILAALACRDGTAPGGSTRAISSYPAEVLPGSPSQQPRQIFTQN